MLFKPPIFFQPEPVFIQSLPVSRDVHIAPFATGPSFVKSLPDLIRGLSTSLPNKYRWLNSHWTLFKASNEVLFKIALISATILSRDSLSINSVLLLINNINLYCENKKYNRNPLISSKEQHSL